ncbi:hypothetical protein [Motilibacter deserti]|nr:hypothetical protein [Motilibacter deserti]
MRSAVLAAEEHANELPADPLVIGLITFGILIVALLITISFNHDR